MIAHAYWIVLLPLISALIIFFFGRWLPLRGAILGVLAMGYGLVHSIGILLQFFGNGAAAATELTMTWFRFGIYQTELGMIIDGLSALMLVVVTLVSFLVHVYSLGYMKGDPRFKRYFAYLSFFTFSMLVLVVANNFLQMFVGWELVGVSSYLLIGFWFEKESAAYAGRKAFITNKVGDVGFTIAILMVFSLLGTLNFVQVQGRIAEGLISPQVCAIIALFLFCGAAAKSSQVPFHIWLPDAMEGPTPVSALMHAATMVAAGVYMVSRTYFVFEHGPFSLEVVAWVGGITALMAATMALTATDIKRVLAFSTVSQLGYMMLALGVGSRTAGMFHLTTHAFFKALLFLGAGSVIHAVHSNDIREMGGLSKKMIATFWTFSFGWIAISGIWPFAGFFSKDMILESAYSSGHVALFWLCVFVALLTAFYMTRLCLIVFVNDPKDMHKFNHAHESPASMVLPMVVLAFLSLAAGIFFKYGVDIGALLSGVAAAPEAAEAAHGPAWLVPVVGSAAAVSGIALGFLFYVKRTFSAEALANTFRPVYNLFYNRYWIDELYLKVFVKPVDGLAQLLARFDSEVFDAWGVDGVGMITLQISRLQNWFDAHVVDGLVDLWGAVAQSFGSILRKFQTGLVQNYILFLVVGVWLLMLWKLGLHFGNFAHLF